MLTASTAFVYLVGMISPRLTLRSSLRQATGALLCLALMAPEVAAAPQGAGDIQLTDFRSPEACRDCHKAVYEDYLQTSHSRAMSEIVPGEMEDLFTPEQQYFYVKKDTARSIFYKLVSSDAGYEQQIFTPGKNGPQQLNRLTIDLQLGSGKLSRVSCAGMATGSSSTPFHIIPVRNSGLSGPARAVTCTACRGNGR